MPYSYSFDEEDYYGAFETREEALAEAKEEREECGGCFTALNVTPPQPETFWFARDWLDNVSEQDDYCMPCAENWDRSTKEQRAELETEVRAVMAAWLDRHNLRPTFFGVDEIQEHTDLDLEDCD